MYIIRIKYCKKKTKCSIIEFEPKIYINFDVKNQPR